MKKNILLMIILTMGLIGSSFALGGTTSTTTTTSTSTLPTVQIASYSTTPTTLYPGVTGQLELTLDNAGGDTATGTTIFYSNGPSSGESTVGVGSIGAGSSTVVSLPIVVPNSVATGILPISMTIYYTSSSGTYTQDTPASVSLQISEHSALQVQTINTNGTFIAPGDQFTEELNITNTGGVANDVTLQAISGSSFTLEGTSQQIIGNIAPGQSVMTNVALQSDSNLTSGEYEVPLEVQYQDELQNINTQNISIGPVTVSQPASQFNIQLTPVDGTEVGSAAQFELSIQNKGATPASATIQINQGQNASTEFTPLGNNIVYFDSIGPGQTETQEVNIGIDPSAAQGYYSMPLTITANGEQFEQDIGIEIQASQQLTVSTTTTPTTVVAGDGSVQVSAEVANTGNTPIRSVYLSLNPSSDFEYIGATESFVGTLNIDDFSTLGFTIRVPNNISSGTYQIPIEVTYKDGENIQHSIVEYAEIPVYSTADSARLGLAAAGGAAGTSGYAGRRAGGIFGLSLPEEIVLGIVILVLAYFGYKKYIARPKK